MALLFRGARSRIAASHVAWPLVRLYNCIKRRVLIFGGVQFQQCGGGNYKGPTACVSGYKCKVSYPSPFSYYLDANINLRRSLLS